MSRLQKGIPLVALLMVAGCDTMPQGPTVTALPGTNETFDEFRTHDVGCRQFADIQVANAISASAVRPIGLTTIPTGPAVCAAANAAGEDHGAAAARSGSLIDGIDSAQFAGIGLQRHYNCAYVQCMYTKGDKVPFLARERWPAPRSPWPPDPDAYYPRLRL